MIFWIFFSMPMYPHDMISWRKLTIHYLPNSISDLARWILDWTGSRSRTRQTSSSSVDHRHMAFNIYGLDWLQEGTKSSLFAHSI